MGANCEWVVVIVLPGFTGIVKMYKKLSNMILDNCSSHEYLRYLIISRHCWRNEVFLSLGAYTSNVFANIHTMILKILTLTADKRCMEGALVVFGMGVILFYVQQDPRSAVVVGF